MNMEEHIQNHKSVFKHFKLLISLVLLLAAIALGAYAYATVKETRYLFSGPTTISVSGKGEVIARPDIGTFSFSVLAEADNPTVAQEESAQAINDITAFLKDEGSVEETDIKTTSYNLTPKYEFTREICEVGFCPPGRQELVGYTVNQTISVKVRDTEDAGDLISGVGERGATNISGLNFTIDDEETLNIEARKAAIADAKENAKELARDLDVRIVRLVGFSDNNDRFFPPYGGYGFAEDAAIETATLRAAPSIPTGENTITSNVVLIYEVR